MGVVTQVLSLLSVLFCTSHRNVTGDLCLTKELTVRFDTIQKVEEYPVEEIRREGQE